MQLGESLFVLWFQRDECVMVGRDGSSEAEIFFIWNHKYKAERAD